MLKFFRSIPTENDKDYGFIYVFANRLDPTTDCVNICYTTTPDVMVEIIDLSKQKHMHVPSLNDIPHVEYNNIDDFIAELERDTNSYCARFSSIYDFGVSKYLYTRANDDNFKSVFTLCPKSDKYFRREKYIMQRLSQVYPGSYAPCLYPEHCCEVVDGWYCLLLNDLTLGYIS